MDLRQKVNEILENGREKAVRELDRLFFLESGYQYWDKVLSQNRVFLANCVTLLFYVKELCPEWENAVSFDMLQKVACDVTGCREILHQLEKTAGGRGRGREDMWSQLNELLSWFNATCVNSRSSFYENTEYLRMLLRYPELGDFDF